MAIVEIKRSNRPNTDIPFFSGVITPGPHLQRYKIAHDDLVATGKIIYNIQRSEDGLVQTVTCTYNNINSFSERDTLLSIDFDNEYFEYVAVHGLNTGDVVVEQYRLDGINEAFTCTTTYNTGTLDPSFNFFVNAIESSDKLTSLINTGSSIIAVHQYENSNDFTENHWRDYTFISFLSAAGVTRTIEYKIV